MYRHFSKPILPAVLALLTGASAANAAQTYTLESALETAYQQSPALQKLEAQRDEYKWKNAEGLSVFIPSVGLSANHYFEKQYQLLDVSIGNGPNVEIPQIFPTSSGNISAKWLLFDGLANVNTYRAGHNMKEAGEKEYAWAHFQLERQVTMAYARVIAAKKLDDVAVEDLKTLENHLKQVNDLKKGGLATNYDVLRVESQLSEAQTELIEAQDNIAIAQDRLGQSMGLSEPADSAPEADLLVPSAEKVKNLTYNQQQNNRLDLQALSNRVEASDLMQAGDNRRFWIPKFGMVADYIKYNNLTDPLTDWNNYRNAWDVGFYLTWDIFNPRQFTQARQEKYQAVQQQKSLVAANQAAPVDFDFWKKRYLYSASLYQAKSIDLNRATETVRLAQAGFKAGVRTTTDVLDAELDLFRARAGVVNAMMNATEAKEQLELALGESL